MASEIIYGQLFSEKLFRAQLSYFDDIDYSEEIEYLVKQPSDKEIKKFLTQTALAILQYSSYSFISPAEAVRRQLAQIIGEDSFQLVFINADLEYCRKNDHYGLYKMAEDGKLSHLAGIDEEYEIPIDAIAIDTQKKDIGVEAILRQ